MLAKRKKRVRKTAMPRDWRTKESRWVMPFGLTGGKGIACWCRWEGTNWMVSIDSCHDF